MLPSISSLTNFISGTLTLIIFFDFISTDNFSFGKDTALLDAIGKTIAKEKAIQDTLPKGEKATKVLFIIITDGLENASKEYNSATVKRLIETQKEKYGWEFLFLGANIDAIETASAIGISAERAVNYNSDSVGTQLNYKSLNKAVTEVRSGNELKKEWKADIEADYQQRNKK